MTRMMAFGDLVTEVSRLIEVLDDEEYSCGGVRLHGKGVFVREYKLGTDLKKKFVQHTVRPGDIVYSTLFAKVGAFAVAEADVDGAVLSEKFPTFRLVDERLSLDYLRWFFRSGQLNRIAEEQATGMAAFSLSHLSKKKFLKLQVPVPSTERQEEVVTYCNQVSECIRRVELPTAENTRLAPHIVGATAERIFSAMPRVKLGSLGEYMTRAAEIEPDMEYMQVTVAMNHRGLRLRRICEGKEIKSPGQCYVRAGDILFSRIDIRQGAIGIVGKSLDGGVVTRDFPVFQLHKTTDTTLEFMRYVFLSTSFMAQAKDASRGTTGRKKLKRYMFLDFDVPWPSDAVQISAISKLKAIEREAGLLADTYKAERILVKGLGEAAVGTLFAKDAGLMV
jgi:type I restriction enzyme S subunit